MMLNTQFFGALIVSLTLTIFNGAPSYASTKNNTEFSSNYYLTWQAGISKRQKAPLGSGIKSFDAGPNVGAAVGYFLKPNLRVELDLDSHQAPLDAVTDRIPGVLSAEEISYAIMANAYYNLGNWNGFNPYVGAGLGLGVIEFSNHVNILPPPSMRHDRYKSKRFAYEFMGGVNRHISNDLLIGLEYRYFRMPTIVYLGRKSSATIDNVLAKVTYLFDGNSAIDKNNVVMYRKIGIFTTLSGGISIRSLEPFGSGGKKFHNGPFLAAALGYAFSDLFHGELEFSSRQNEVHRVYLAVNSGNRVSGDENTLAIMANVYLRKPLTSSIIPYVGIGGGYTRTSYAQHVNLPPNIPMVPPTFPTFRHPRESNSGGAYQAMGGLTYRATDNASFSAEYRYFNRNNIKYKSFNNRIILSNIKADTINLKFSYMLPT
jgi:opacity protein-like surface antigen